MLQQYKRCSSNENSFYLTNLISQVFKVIFSQLTFSVSGNVPWKPLLLHQNAGAAVEPAPT